MNKIKIKNPSTNDIEIITVDNPLPNSSNYSEEEAVEKYNFVCKKLLEEGNLRTLVLYTKGNRKEIMQTFNKDKHTFVNCKYSELKSDTQGMRFRSVVVADGGVCEEDILLAESRVISDDTTYKVWFVEE